jgi:hypothetical protein
MRRDSIRVARDMAYKRTAMLEFTRERPALFPPEEFDRFDRQIHRYAALVEDAQEYAEDCQSLVEELRAQVEEETNRNLYTLTMFSVIFLPATLRAGDRQRRSGMLRRDTKLPDRTTLVDYRGGPAAVAVSRSCSCQASTPSVTHS